MYPQKLPNDIETLALKTEYKLEKKIEPWKLFSMNLFL